MLFVIIGLVWNIAINSDCNYLSVTHIWTPAIKVPRLYKCYNRWIRMCVALHNIAVLKFQYTAPMPPTREKYTTCFSSNVWYGR